MRAALCGSRGSAAPVARHRSTTCSEARASHSPGGGGASSAAVRSRSIVGSAATASLRPSCAERQRAETAEAPFGAQLDE